MTIMPRRAFTLVEIAVVMGILVLLLGLVLTVGSAVMNQSRRQETRDTLQLLDLAVQEWRSRSGRRLTWWDVRDEDTLDPARFDVRGSTPEVLILSEVLEVIMRDPAVADIIARIDADRLYVFRAGTYPEWLGDPDDRAVMDARFDGSLTVLDAWDMPIYATHPGRPWRPDLDGDSFRDPDGTIRTYNELNYGIPTNRRMCFVSAGPDRRFGEVDRPADDPVYADTQDNLFSYPPRLKVEW